MGTVAVLLGVKTVAPARLSLVAERYIFSVCRLSLVAERCIFSMYRLRFCGLCRLSLVAE